MNVAVDEKEKMIAPDYTYAIVGASANVEKYGYKVLKDLTDAGYTVYPVNPKGGEILGLRVFERVSDITAKIDVVIFVVPPVVTEKILPEVRDHGITKVWLQPGSENDAVIDYCNQNDIVCIHHACIMVMRQEG